MVLARWGAARWSVIRCPLRFLLFNEAWGCGVAGYSLIARRSQSFLNQLTGCSTRSLVADRFRRLCWLAHRRGCCCLPRAACFLQLQSRGRSFSAGAGAG
ncbi:hypothetical protein DFJ73DRAFT_835085 [Zopfochytrium polystomum]|nr:hypothetical protein DFJ73DRAFT_835085 [Zopfochytrium polystomum]